MISLTAISGERARSLATRRNGVNPYRMFLRRVWMQARFRPCNRSVAEAATAPRRGYARNPRADSQRSGKA